MFRNVSDALRTIMREEGWIALYKGIVPGLFLVCYTSACRSNLLLFFFYFFPFLFNFISSLNGYRFINRHMSVLCIYVVHTSLYGVNFLGQITYQPLFAAQFCYLRIYVLFQQVSHGAIQFTAYEELRRVLVDFKSRKSTEKSRSSDSVLVCCWSPVYEIVIGVLQDILGPFTNSSTWCWKTVMLSKILSLHIKALHIQDRDSKCHFQNVLAGVGN